MTYRATKQASTNYSPAQLIYSRKMRLPASLVCPLPDTVEQPLTEYVANKEKLMRETHDAARRRMNISSNQMQLYKKVNPLTKPFEIGDQVYLLDHLNLYTLTYEMVWTIYSYT